MERFLEWAKMDAEQLFQAHLEALRSADPRDRYNVSRKVLVYMVELEEAGLKPATVYGVVKAVSSFMEANGLDFKLNRRRPRIYYEGQRIVEPYEIRDIYESDASLRNRALLITLKDSGLRVSDVVDLNYGDVRQAIDDDRDFVLIRLRQVKSFMLKRNRHAASQPNACE